MNLKEIAGLDIELDIKTGKLNFPGIPGYNNMATRTLTDAREYFLDPTAKRPETLYWMYRDVALPADRPEIEASKLRYDITVLSPGKVGKEFVKTIGHYHPCPKKSEESYPEIYEVLYGHAIYYLQDESISDVVVVEAGPGTQVLMPSGYGHITINADSKYLVMSNVVSSLFTSVYGPIKSSHGGCYYFIEESRKKVWKPNLSYKTHPQIRKVESSKMPILGGVSGPLYTNLISNPKKFTSMNNPEICPGFA